MTTTGNDMPVDPAAQARRTRVAQALWRAYHGATTAWPWDAPDDAWRSLQDQDRKRFEYLADVAIAAGGEV